MGLLPITEKGMPTACHADWPLFYMNDFSRLGLIVARLGEALETLRRGGFRVLTSATGSGVEVDGSEQIQEVVAALRRERMDFEVADLISCAYQG